MRGSDVLSICSLAVSTKNSHEHIGKKGIGFKSVFAVSNKPALISHSWRFYFDVKKGDEMSYITPIWINNDNDMLKKIEAHISKDPSYTHIYLPLRRSYRSAEGDKYLDHIFQAIDPYMLINLRNIKHIEVVDTRKDKAKLFQKKIIDNSKANYDEEIVFEEFKFKNFEHELVEVTDGVTVHSFRIYKACINNMHVKQRIMLGFPCELDYQLSYNVYTGLPVCNLGWNFIFNGDFELVTNRESVRENDIYNENIRDHLSVFFVYTMLNDENVRKNLNYYYPTNKDEGTSYSSSWWLPMLSRMRELLKKNSTKLFNINTGLMSF